MLDLFISHSILQPTLLSRHVCPASAARNNSLRVAGLRVILVYDYIFMVLKRLVRKGFFFYKSLVRLKEGTWELYFREREVFPLVSLTLVQIRFIVATAMESLAPLRTARQDFVCTLISRSVEW